MHIKYLQVFDEAGNRHDYDAEFVPRIGERVRMTFGRGGAPVAGHYFRVKDVDYLVDNGQERVSLLIEEERDPVRWP